MKLPGRIITAVVFLVLALGTMAVFLRIYSPKPRPPNEVPFDAYDRRPMTAALQPDQVAREVATLAGFGSRFIGQPGFQRAADYVEQRFTEAGLEVLTQDLDTLAPHTVRREILGVEGQPLRDVEVYPFFPNHFQPMVTPPEGLTGQLILLTDDVLAQRSRFDDCIGVVDAVNPPKAYGCDWSRYAQLGVKAIIVSPRSGLNDLTAERWATLNPQMVGNDPINYVRLLGNAAVYRYLDQPVTLHVRTEFRSYPNRTIIGILKSGRPNRDAVVVTAPYDAYSYLPDLAPGVVTAYEIAELLRVLEGLRAHRSELRRDVIFIATGTRVMADEAETRLLGALGPRLDRASHRNKLVERQESNLAGQQLVKQALALFERPGFAAELAPTEAGLATLSKPARDFLNEQVRYVLNSFVVEDSERMLAAKIEFLAGNTRDLTTPEYRDYLAAKRGYDNTFSAAGYSLDRLLAARGELASAKHFDQRLKQRLTSLAEFHEREAAKQTQALALHDLFARYGQVITVAPKLVPSATGGKESVTFFMGITTDHRFDGPNFNNLSLAAVQRTGGGVDCVSYTKNHNTTIGSSVGNIPLGVELWNQFSYPAVALVNVDRKGAYDDYPVPVELPYMRNAGSLAGSLQWLGELVQSLAYGNGKFSEPRNVTPLSTFGTVYVSGVGESIVPNYPMAGAIVGGKGPAFQEAGRFGCLFLQTDPYGRYSVYDSPSHFAVPGAPFSPNAVAFGTGGIIAYANDEGAAQSIYQSVNLSMWGGLQTPVNLVLFRATPVTVLDLVNPQTLKPYAGMELAQADKLTAFPSLNVFQTAGPVTTFIPPEERFIVKLKAGSAENDLVQTTRAVMLNTKPGQTARSLSEVEAPGYLAARTPFVLRVPEETARSMLSLNSQRLAALERNRMADARTLEFHKKAGELLAESEQKQGPELNATLRARDSATYSILNYPVIRGAIFDAVYGILWYLFLLVPFVFFFEKLVFGFTDIRKQLTADALIFVVVFLLLKWLHPAFEMIRSSLMILLGFVIFLISMGVIFLLSGRFRENLEALRRKRAQVAAAEVNTMGVVGTAFALGLNNMHRRKVRTGLTCATLVLITFAMLCFSTLQSDIVDSATATGKAPYQGILVKPEQFRPISGAEQFALNVKYGTQFKVAPRTVFVGWETWTRELYNPSLAISRTTAEGELRKVEFTSIIQLSPAEPLAPQMPLLTTNGWFTEVIPGQPIPVMLPEPMARKLGLTVAQVNRERPKVTINGKEFVVCGIFDADKFANLRDLDGRNLLPFDVTAMTTVRNTGSGRYFEVIAEDTDPLMSAENVILTGTSNLGLTVPNGFPRLVSVAVAMPNLNYREARAEIGQYLEQTGKPAYYGLDSVSYIGKRFRDTSFAGLLDLLIPLFIASITVLNTIRGSVYERRDEIFVYNAVGIAPRYVFFMFMAEALVYSVVGTVLGYLLAQGTGSVLTALDLTGGLQMNFTSKITVYVSVTIILATLASTFFPARSALEIAAPAEDAGWKLPEPEGDRLSFALPFTFNHHDRVAILAFFHRYFLDHGEGSAASFFAGPPGLGVSDRSDPLQPDSYIPEIRSTIWLKPYDLGVSQELVIDLQTDPETKEYIARITLERLSGTREAWLRLNHSFVSQVRRHFLHWRAVGKEDRAELYAEARQLLEENLKTTHA